MPRKIVNAIRKQIPKEPRLEAIGCNGDGNDIYGIWFCPNCEREFEVEFDDYDYCPDCGQRIDWRRN